MKRRWFSPRENRGANRKCEGSNLIRDRSIYAWNIYQGWHGVSKIFPAFTFYCQWKFASRSESERMTNLASSRRSRSPRTELVCKLQECESAKSGRLGISLSRITANPCFDFGWRLHEGEHGNRIYIGSVGSFDRRREKARNRLGNHLSETTAFQRRLQLPRPI